ncbi:MAG: metal-sensitive transcriptional regulator [Nitrospirae bacterium]|nr:metal-sensitive transcriptional regulator [Nitrospirota bacterium]
MKSPDQVCHPGDKTVVQPHKALLLKRLNRVAGQVKGISKMIEEDRYCVDIVTQVSAVKSALDEVVLRLLEDHVSGCVQDAIQHGGGEKAISELIQVTRKFIRS